ncbi:hypothetical protein HZB58_03850 [Candidatus Gottesmanbacteria bacterium]|nr:hypothetical protein [Candidatus Gottesmanbacteria bacterium]
MTTIFACHQGKERSVVLAGLYRAAGRDVESFEGGIERMITLSEDELGQEIGQEDDVVLICESWGPRDPQLRAVQTAEELLSGIGRRYSRGTSRELMKAIVFRKK